MGFGFRVLWMEETLHHLVSPKCHNWLKRVVPYFLHPENPKALNPQPSTPNPKPQALNSKPKTLNPSPKLLTPNPKHCVFLKLKDCVFQIGRHQGRGCGKTIPLPHCDIKKKEMRPAVSEGGFRVWGLGSRVFGLGFLKGGLGFK